jgi:adhesin transport system membrane fusion protein
MLLHKEKSSKLNLNYIDDINAAMLITAPYRSKLVLYVVCGFFFCFLIWAGFSEIDEVTVGSGKVIPSGQVQIIQNLEGGIVAEIFVKEGQNVKKHQELIRIDDTRFLAEFKEKQQEVFLLRTMKARLKAEMNSVKWSKDISDSDWKKQIEIIEQPLNILTEEKDLYPEIYASGLASLKANISNLSEQMEVFNHQIEQKEQEIISIESTYEHAKTSYELGIEELNLTSPLAERGVISPVEFLKLKRQINELGQEQEKAKLALPRSKTALKETINKRQELVSQYLKEAQDTYTKARSQLAQLIEKQVSLKDRVARTSVLSPTSGAIKTININTVGGVIQPGMDLIEIVPDEDQLLIEAKVSPKDIGFLRPGLKAVVRFTAFDFAIYGGLEGVLEHISADSLEDEKGNSYYLVRVRTNEKFLVNKRNKNIKMPIIPGMMASVDLLTGKKTVLSYLLKPILRAHQSALRER